MLQKIGTAILWFVAAFMLSSVTIFNPQQVTDFFVKLFNIRPSIPELKPVVISARDEEIKGIAESISEGRVQGIVDSLSSMGSRMPGYAGHRQAFEFVKREFEEIGLEDIAVDEFLTTVPVAVDSLTSLDFMGTGERVQVYGMWPNHVQTPSLPRQGVTGHLIYGGKGTFKELNGKTVEGSIVLMDFGCGQNYLNLRMLGAKAIIFFDNGRMTQGEAQDKFLPVPVDVPRFWVQRAGAELLREMAQSGQHQVKLTSVMAWKEAPAWNIYGTLQGQDAYITERRERKWDEQVIVLSSFYDAISVVPSLAPGAENATGMAALLETARVLKENPPKYTVMFLATGAHFQGLAGINDFLYRHSRESGYFRDMIPDSVF